MSLIDLHAYNLSAYNISFHNCLEEGFDLDASNVTIHVTQHLEGGKAPGHSLL